MTLPVRLFSPGRALAALLLLVTLVAGEAADSRHHLSEHGCAADTGGRSDHCTCASLHSVSLAGQSPAQPAPVALERDFAPPPTRTAPRACVALGAAPRAPPTA